MAINDLLLRKHFKEMTRTFLSVFRDRELIGDYKDDAATLKEICSKDTKFNTLYIKDKKKTQKIYEKFVTTNLFKSAYRAKSFAKMLN